PGAGQGVAGDSPPPRSTRDRRASLQGTGAGAPAVRRRGLSTDDRPRRAGPSGRPPTRPRRSPVPRLPPARPTLPPAAEGAPARQQQPPAAWRRGSGLGRAPLGLRHAPPHRVAGPGRAASRYAVAADGGDGRPDLRDGGPSSRTLLPRRAAPLGATRVALR